MTGADLARELSGMAAEDLRVREELRREGSLFAGYHPRMEAVHQGNGARLSRILDVHGWPGPALVGADGARAAWLVLQHAIGDPPLMRRGLALLRQAPPGEVPALDLAMLEDRILALEGRGQRYGTQFDWDAQGELSPVPIDAPDMVDQRRAGIGLGPLAEAIQRRRAEAAEAGERPPIDRPARQREMAAWLMRVGWRR